MSTTWIDTPGSTLSSRVASTNFSVSTEPSSISVNFGPANTEELAYRDGTFLYPYLGSTKSGGTFSLVRSGGWPSTPTVYVGEGSTSARTWGAVYTVNLTSQPAIASITPGSFTVDGMTWWCKGSLDTGGSAALVAGQGLQVTRSAIHSWIGSNTGDLPGSLYFDFEQISGFNTSAPFAVQFWWYQSTIAYPSNIMGCAGIVSAAKNSSAITDDESRSGFFHTAYFQSASVNDTRLVVRNNGQSSYNIIDSATSDSNLRNHRYTLLQTCVGRVVCGYSDVNTTSGAFSGLADLSVPRAFAPVPEGNASVRKYGFMQTVINTLGAAFGAQSCTLGGLQVLQPKV